MSPEGLSQGLSLDKVDLATEQDVQFITHIHEVPQTPGCFRLETHENVDIAVGAEILAQDGAEQSKLLDLPPAAESNEPIFRDVDSVKFPNCLYSTLLATIR